jgi:SAM-dependent methyltransferase
MSTTADQTADQQLKAKHRALWAVGDYPAVATDLIPALGPTLVEASGVRAGQRVLDVAAGSGNAAIPAAATGASVVASDLTPELFDAGRRIAAQRGVDPEWVEADVEGLPFADHWRPPGFIGQLFATMKPYAPPPPPGASPAPLWGDEEHVRALFGNRITDIDVQRHTVVMEHDGDPAGFREYWKRNYGPTIAVYKHNATDPDRVAALDRDFLELLTTWNEADTPGRTSYHAEYLLVTARRSLT